MRSGVKRLVQLLLDPEAPLSRNRHFAALEDAEGKRALRIARHLRSLARDLSTWPPEAMEAALRPVSDAAGPGWELSFDWHAPPAAGPEGLPRGRRTARLSADEWELLAALPGIAARVRREG